MGKARLEGSGDLDIKLSIFVVNFNCSVLLISAQSICFAVALTYNQ